MYILWWWNTVQSFSISNMVSEPLLWLFLSSLVFIGVTSLVLLHSQHRFRHHNSRHNLLPLNLRRLRAIVFGFQTYSRCRWGVLHCRNYCTSCLRRVYCSNYISRGITKIVLHRSTCRWKPCIHQRPHTPSRAAQSFYISTPRAVLTSNWRHLWRH